MSGQLADFSRTFCELIADFFGEKPVYYGSISKAREGPRAIFGHFPRFYYAQGAGVCLNGWQESNQ